MGIVDDEPALEAGGAPVGAGEGLGSEAQPAGLGHVLGVVDDEAGAAGGRPGGVQRAGLGARQPRRHRQDLEMRRQVLAGEGGGGGAVVGLDQEFDVELDRRIVERLERLDEARHHRRLPVEPDEHRVD
ncbi:hypothetical protein QU38_01075, partial [Staphylococcus aureus]